MQALSKKSAAEVIATLKKMGTKATRDGLARYAIPSDRAFGISVGAIRALAKKLGRNHELGAALWETGWYEARMLAVFLDDPESVTSAQMDRWCKDFDSWAICDTACFHPFDKTPLAWKKIVQWSRRAAEFERRAAFALLASVALHDKKADDACFADCLPLIEEAADDGRNFVKKAVSWALRGIGRRSLPLNALSVALAQRLASSTNAAERWVGKDAYKELTGPVVKKRLAKLKKSG